MLFVTSAFVNFPNQMDVWSMLYRLLNYIKIILKKTQNVHIILYILYSYIYQIILKMSNVSNHFIWNA